MFYIKGTNALAVSILFLLLFSSCSGEDIPISAASDIIIVPSLQSKSIKVFSYDRQGRINTVIMGDKDTIFKNSKEVWLDKLRALYISYDEKELIYTELTANKGKVNYDTLNFEAWGDAVIIRENNMRLETNKVFWDNERELLYTTGEDRVVIYKQDYPNDTIVKVIGTNLVADKKLSSVELDEAVSVSPYLEGY